MSVIFETHLNPAGTNIGGALRSAVRLAGKRDYDRWPTYRAGGSDRPQSIIIFLTDGLPTVGTLSLGRVLAQTRAQNAEIKVSSSESIHMLC